MSTLNLFPARVAIGVVQENGTVLMTPEFFRALTDVLQRVGGEGGSDNSDLELMSSTALPPVVDFSQFYDVMAALQVAEASNAEMQKRINDLEALSGYTDPFRVNWERPGSIGSLTPAPGAFTTLTASGAVTLSPANANVTISPTGTGTVTFAPATVGTINNMSIGATTAATGRFTTLTTTGAATIATGFGCNGKTAQTAAALGAAATDLPTVITLANNIRTALINNGIGS